MTHGPKIRSVRAALASLTFLDYIAAFDSVDHIFLDEALGISGASSKTRAIIRSIYSSASTIVRCRDENFGHTAFSDAFSVDRGVVQGDIVIPYCFIIALQLIFLQHDDNPQHSVILQRGTTRECRIGALKYVDDANIVSNSIAESSLRATNLARGSCEDGKLEAHEFKSEHMPIVLRDVLDA